MIYLTLPVPPSVNRYWRTRVMTVKGRQLPQVYPSAEAKAYKDAVQAHCLTLGIRQPLVGRISILMQLYPPRPKDWAARQRKDPSGWDDSVMRPDIDNVRKALYDTLKSVVFADDKMVYRDAAEVMEPDEHGPRVEVTIRQVVRRTPQTGLPGVEALPDAPAAAATLQVSTPKDEELPF